MHFRSSIHWSAAALLTLLAIYCALGVFQALSLFQGERALRNVNLWSSGALVAVVLACLAAPRRRVTSASASIFQRTAPWIYFGLVAFALWPAVGHLLAVDKCLDRGGSYNYVVGACSFESNSPFMQLHHSHGFLLVAAGLFLLLGLGSSFKLAAIKRLAHSAA